MNPCMPGRNPRSGSRHRTRKHSKTRYVVAGRRRDILRLVTYAIEARGLVKRFGKTLAVDGGDLAVSPGMVLGLLGPNGAGKTTVGRMLATLLAPDAGSAKVCGDDVVRHADPGRELIA